ncbi:MAG: hypothetical protein ABSA40_08645 [Candidatus Dormibacteria bacterium]
MSELREAKVLHGFRFALIGALAANHYMAPRYSADIDFAVLERDAIAVEEHLRAERWQMVGGLVMTDLTGTTWRAVGGGQVDLVYLPDSWGSPALDMASTNVLDGVPTVTLPYLVLMKLLAARGKDTADVEELLVGKSRARVVEVREVVGRFGRPGDLEDLDQIIELSAWRTSRARTSPPRRRGPSPRGG